MTGAAYEIYGRGFGWCWRLRLDEGAVATGGRHHDQPRQVHDDIDHLRRALANVANDGDAIESTGVLDSQSLAENADGVDAATHDARLVVEEEPTPSGELPPDRDNWVWRLETPNAVLAYSAHRYPTEAATRGAARRFPEQGLGSLPVVLLTNRADWLGTEAGRDRSPFVRVVLARLPVGGCA